MIKYSLLCSAEHEFEAWFRNSDAYEGQVTAGEVSCPFCGDVRVRKALMAPSVITSTGQQRRPADIVETTAVAPAAASAVSAPVAAGTPATFPAEAEAPLVAMRRMLETVRQHVEANCDYVGDKFAEEARRIHYGETEDRPIYGHASEAEAEALCDEGVDMVMIPWLPRQDS